MIGVDLRRISKLQRVTLAKRALRRMAEMWAPEQALWLGVLHSAIEDLALPPGEPPHLLAVRYFAGAFPYEVHAEFAGLDPDAVRLVLRQAGLLEADISPEDRCIAATA